MKKPARKMANRRTHRSGGGKAAAGGPIYQAQIAAWVAVHILAGRPLRDAFGINLGAFPKLVRLEQATTYDVDDIIVDFDPEGRVLVQATTALTLTLGATENPSKLHKSLLQAFHTWRRRKIPQQRQEYDQPLSRARDAIVIAVPADAPTTLMHLHKALRQCDRVDRMADASLAELNKEENTAIQMALSVFRSAYEEANNKTAKDDELVELLGLVRVVKIDADRGQHDRNDAINLLRDHVLSDPNKAEDAWACLLSLTLDLMRSASGANRGGLERELLRHGHELKQPLAQQISKVEESLPHQPTLPRCQPEQGDGNSPQLPWPAHLAESELRERLRRARQRINLPDESFDYRLAITDLAERTLGGEFQTAPPQLRFEVLDFAVRANASSAQTADKARHLLAAAKQIYPMGSCKVAEAAILALVDPDSAMRQLRERSSPTAKSLLFSLVGKSQGEKGAHDWIQQQKLSPEMFNAVGVFGVVANAINVADFDFAAQWIEQASEDQLKELPALRLWRGRIRLASCVPPDQRLYLVAGLPLDVGAIILAQDSEALARRQSALVDFRETLAAVKELGVATLSEEIDEIVLWLRLQDPATRAAARSQLDAEVKNPELTLWRARLALLFGSAFDQDALRATLQRRRAEGGWTKQEATVAVALELASNNPERIAKFMSESRDALAKAGGMPEAGIAFLEIEALARSGSIEIAKERQRQYANVLGRGHCEILERLIAECEGTADSAENARIHFEQTQLTDDLRRLCNELDKKNDIPGLCEFGAELARRSRNLQDLRLVLKAMTSAGRHRSITELCDELTGLGEDDDYVQFSRARAFYFLGRVREAREILDRKFAQSIDTAVIILAIQASWEAGDWAHIQGLLDHLAARTEDFEPIELARFATLARDTGSRHAKTLIDTAVDRANDDPRVYVAAYMFAVEQGKEDGDPRAQEWFQKAAELSGDDGPLERKSLREVADMMPGWREHTDRINQLLKTGEMPLFLAARGLHVAFTSASLGQAIGNNASVDPRMKFPIYAFHGRQRQVDLAAASTLALDISALLTLSHLGLLKKVVDSFDRVVIGWGTLTMLFLEQQRIRFHQPSRIARAKQLKAMIDSGLLTVLEPQPAPLPKELVMEIGEESALLFVAAHANSGLVVQPGPLHRAGTFLEETAHLGSFGEQVTDTRQVVNFLKNEAALLQQHEEEASAYIHRVDQSMPGARPINKETPLFLDDVAVSYLTHTRLLDVLADRAGPLTVSPNLKSEIEALLRYESESSHLLEHIESIREVLFPGIQSGKIVIAEPTTFSQKADNDEEELRQSPSITLLHSQTQFDAVIADDRGLNRWSEWQASFGNAPIATTVDVIDELRRRGAINGAREAQARNDLRQAHFQLFAPRTDELVSLVNRAPVLDGSLKETPELRNIREDFSLAIAKYPMQGAEAPWVTATRKAILGAIRELWSGQGDAIEIRADWLLSILPNIADFARRPLEPIASHQLQQLAAAQTAEFFGGISGDAATLTRYRAWVQTRIVEPLEDADPNRLEQAITQFKAFIKEVADDAEA